MQLLWTGEKQSVSARMSRQGGVCVTRSHICGVGREKKEPRLIPQSDTRFKAITTLLKEAVDDVRRRRVEKWRRSRRPREPRRASGSHSGRTSIVDSRSPFPSCQYRTTDNNNSETEDQDAVHEHRTRNDLLSLMMLDPDPQSQTTL